jgi:3-phenylpropionate/cinnamic acid dioxygenase small subunit
VADAEARALHYEVEQFLYHEAWLLDQRRFHEWLDLFADDARYVMPVRETTQRPPDADLAVAGAHFHDDKAFLTLRVRRLDTGMAHAEQPASRTRHLIGNVQVYEGDAVSAEIGVRSSFMVFQGRLEQSEHLFVGMREDRLRRVAGAWRIARREITIDHTTLPRSLTTFF